MIDAEDLQKKRYNSFLRITELGRMLQTSGVVILGGGLAGYLGIRLAQAILSEILEALPIANSIITAIAFGSSTFIVGFAWLAIVEQNYVLQHSEEG